MTQVAGSWEARSRRRVAGWALYMASEKTGVHHGKQRQPSHLKGATFKTALTLPGFPSITQDGV